MQEREPLRASPDEVVKYLQGIHYPCRKRDLLDFATKHNAPRGVVRSLEIIRDEIFDNEDDVKEGIGRERHKSGER